MSGQQEEDEQGGQQVSVEEDEQGGQKVSVEEDEQGGQQVSVEEEEELREEQWWMHVCVYLCL